MKVRTRLLYFGVAAPALGLLAAVSGAGLWFRQDALASVDRELVARAAVESVGAFDGPRPHLHLGRATFPRGFIELDPRGALYDDQGVVARDPPNEPALPRGPFAIDGVQKPQLWTANGRRELAVSLIAPDNQHYLMRLSCSLGPLSQTLNTYVRTTTGLIATVVLALLLLWLWLARSISQRLERITEALPRGEELPSWREQEPGASDEIAALDRGLAEAFARLREAKDTQDEFIARAAHELKTPLGVMAAEIDLALSRPREPAELQRALASSRGEVKRLAELSTRLLDLTAVHGVELSIQPVDMVRMIYESLDGLAPALEHAEVSIEADLPRTLLVQADAMLVRQAIDNLLANALRHSPKAGAIRLALQRHVAQAQLDIRDEGAGIPDAERERVFEPFVRGSNAHGAGSGLGLSIVRAIARRLHGSVSVLASERGAHLRLCLPLAADSGNGRGALSA